MHASRRRRAGLIVVLAVTGGLVPLRVAADLDGGRIYWRDCARCHGAHGRGDGPDAVIFASPPRSLRTEFLSVYSTGELVRRVRRGSPLRLEVDPKAAETRAAQVGLLAAYIERLPVIDWERVGPGLETYAERCQPCHGAYGHPPATMPAGVERPRDLSDPAFRRDTNDESLRILVAHGREGLPKLTPPVTDTEAVQVAAAVRLLSPGHELYSRFCSNCHGHDGRGAGSTTQSKIRPMALDGAYFASHSKGHVREQIWHMMAEKKPRMPHLRRTLSETAARAVIEFLKGLQD